MCVDPLGYGLNSAVIDVANTNICTLLSKILGVGGAHSLRGAGNQDVFCGQSLCVHDGILRGLVEAMS